MENLSAGPLGGVDDKNVKIDFKDITGGYELDSFGSE